MASNLWIRYRNYLRDNPRGYWFRRKPYGWGWTPARWQGWLTLAAFVALVLADVLWVDAGSHSGSDTVLIAVALVLALILVCYRTGEPPRWQWGLPEEPEN